MRLADLLLAIAAMPALCAGSYLLWLTLLSRRSAPPVPGAVRHRFEIVIPAHNEESGIAQTIRSVRAIDYPQDMFAVTVIADNCTDRTAEVAQAAGARVLLRQDQAQRGKGYALAYAFTRILSEGRASALVVIDADTVVSSNLLRAFSARLETGAQAVQADYAVLNPSDSWRTRLMAISLGSVHVLRSLARERRKVSCGLRGNGMCFTAELLKQVPHDAFSLVEDLEYGIHLGEAGHRVHYAAEGHAYGAMVTSAVAAQSQRLRWEGGRWKLAQRDGLKLLASAWEKRSPVLLDLALDLLIPPLSFIIVLDVAGLVASAALALARGAVGPSLIAWGVSGLFAAAYVFRGWTLSGTGAQGLLNLLCSPIYVGWRMTLLLRPSKQPPDEWIRTARQGEDLRERPGPRGSPRV
jgi:cellulose synthase/poly-beta-1,6-N-acetylglucosamine synthase-like glycosyltransferase